MWRTGGRASGKRPLSHKEVYTSWRRANWVKLCLQSVYQRNGTTDGVVKATLITLRITFVAASWYKWLAILAAFHQNVFSTIQFDVLLMINRHLGWPYYYCIIREFTFPFAFSKSFSIYFQFVSSSRQGEFKSMSKSDLKILCCNLW